MAENRKTVNPAPEPPIRALEMVRRIRDAFYERTRELSAEELRQFIAQEASAARTEPTTPSAPASERSSAA